MRRAQEHLHAQGMSVTLGSVDCALAQAFGITGSLSELGCQPRDLAAIQVRLDWLLCVLKQQEGWVAEPAAADASNSAASDVCTPTTQLGLRA